MTPTPLTIPSTPSTAFSSPMALGLASGVPPPDHSAPGATPAQPWRPRMKAHTDLYNHSPMSRLSLPPTVHRHVQIRRRKTGGASRGSAGARWSRPAIQYRLSLRIRPDRLHHRLRGHLGGGLQAGQRLVARRDEPLDQQLERVSGAPLPQGTADRVRALPRPPFREAKLRMTVPVPGGGGHCSGSAKPNLRKLGGKLRGNCGEIAGRLWEKLRCRNQTPRCLEEQQLRTDGAECFCVSSNAVHGYHNYYGRRPSISPWNRSTNQRQADMVIQFVLPLGNGATL